MFDDEELFQTHLSNLTKDNRTYVEAEERSAFTKLISSIAAENDHEVKEFMSETLEYYCRETSMLMPYLLDQEWQNAVESYVARKKSFGLVNLFIDLESIVASHVDSSGYTQTAGPRYPLTIPRRYHNAVTTRSVHPDCGTVRLLDSYYAFGVHRLFVGQAIEKILAYLQHRYKLDFQELESGGNNVVSR